MNTKQSFPERLMETLSTRNEILVSASLTWGSNGKTLVIIDRDELATVVIPHFFPELKSLSVFLKRLKCFGFRCIKTGLERGAFYHPLFNQDAPHLCRELVIGRRHSTGESERKSSGGEREQERTNRQQDLAVGGRSMSMNLIDQRVTPVDERSTLVDKRSEASDPKYFEV